MGWPHAGRDAIRRRRAGRSCRIGASEGEFGTVIGQAVAPDGMDMVAALRGELDPDARTVEAHIVAPITHVRRARVGDLHPVEFGLVELAVLGTLGAIIR